MFFLTSCNIGFDGATYIAFFSLFASNNFKAIYIFPVPVGCITATLFDSFNLSVTFLYVSTLCGFNFIDIYNFSLYLI